MGNSIKDFTVGKFYKAYGGPAHPSLIYEIDTKHKTIKSIKFGTTKGKHMTEIHPIQQGYDKSFVHNRPFEGVPSDYDFRELEGLVVDARDLTIIEEIKKKTPMQSKKAKGRYNKNAVEPK